MRPERRDTASLPKDFHFSSNQKFGLITNTVDLQRQREKRVRCNIYKVKEEGTIFLETDPDDLMQMEKVGKMFLVRDASAMPRNAVPLTECQTVEYQQQEIETNKKHIDWIKYNLE